MDNNRFCAGDLNLRPIRAAFYVPPVVWRGDPVGHIGTNDVFFWLLEGEVVLFVEDNCYLMRAGQLAFLPKGKMRRYTNISNNCTLYTMSFFAEADGINLMQGLGFAEGNHVVSIENRAEITGLFESSSRVEMHPMPIYNVIRAANVLMLIKAYSAASEAMYSSKNVDFPEVTEYIRRNLSTEITIQMLADIAHMQPTYFIRRFNLTYGVSPMSYVKALRTQKAMELLLDKTLGIDAICEAVGITDPAYFSRWFKKSCGVTPGEYRKAFHREAEQHII